MRLLLAEDELDLAKALEMFFKHNKYAIDVVHNGKDAYDYAMTGIYDVIVLDVMMPEMDGITVLKNIRTNGIESKVIILTAKSEIDDRVAGLDAGADDYLTKPFATKELLARVRAMTRRKGEISPNILTMDNLYLNMDTYEMGTENGTVKLVNKEYQMMEILLSNPKTVVSTSHFMEKIWGFESNVEQNIVWVNVSYLRRKLLKLGANVEIKSSRNVGYALMPKTDK